MHLKHLAHPRATPSNMFLKFLGVTQHHFFNVTRLQKNRPTQCQAEVGSPCQGRGAYSDVLQQKLLALKELIGFLSLAVGLRRGVEARDTASFASTPDA